MNDLEQRIAKFSGGVPPELRAQARAVADDLLMALEKGEVRAATRDDTGTWHVNSWVKAGILLAFKVGDIVESGAGPLRFLDKDNLTPRTMVAADGVRLVPGGSSIRTGAYVAPGVICMPPMFINVGAYVGEGTMVDSHALVGSCAQVGKRVHLSAAAQVGGVLEPTGAFPVIIEDDVFVGGNCGIYEGALVRAGAVLAPGTILTGATPVYDLVKDRVYRREGCRPLEIPAGAVVVPGSRPATMGKGKKHGVSLYTPVIVKYRDEKTDAKLVLEEVLR
ncbi:MAG: 2,3,4,5-tetrahydropyridine-2,6-dicarboxylate N-succinyltransferase [Gemmatimonadetes bacterium]|nr:2,3,4,5-tetrahydropyridine-2,6-dicarboxylate N-succinyltransferase [Gemmatimonadota bacterium]